MMGDGAILARRATGGLHRRLPGYSVCRQHATSKVMDDCAEICRTAADFMLRGSAQYREVCALCASICDACAKHCEDADGPDECVRSCRGCAESCRSLAGAG
jgi:hypothetical protein